MEVNRLRELREEAILTVRELASRSGVSEDTITKLEHSHRNARPSTIRKLAKALDVTPQELRRAPEPALPLAEAPRGVGQAQEEEVRDLADVAQEALRHIEAIYDQWRRARARLDASEGVPQTYIVEAETKLVGLFAPLHRDAAPQVLSMIGLDLRRRNAQLERRIAQLEEENAQQREERERVEAENT